MDLLTTKEDKTMTNYVISWEIDIEADTPEEAAKKAVKYMDNPRCRSFTATDEDGGRTIIDLEGEM